MMRVWELQKKTDNPNIFLSSLEWIGLFLSLPLFLSFCPYVEGETLQHVDTLPGRATLIYILSLGSNIESTIIIYGIKS
jgi:hypothetical protein